MQASACKDGSVVGSQKTVSKTNIRIRKLPRKRSETNVRIRKRPRVQIRNDIRIRTAQTRGKVRNNIRIRKKPTDCAKCSDRASFARRTDFQGNDLKRYRFDEN